MDDLYQQIEKRYGFRLPEEYRQMREKDLFDFDPATDGDVGWNPPGHRYLWLNEMEWLSLEKIRDFNFPSYCMSGFVPFAFTGGGDHWCWYPQFTADDQTPVVFCPHDSNTGSFYAPHFVGSLYRQTLDYAQGWFQTNEADVARAHFKRWATDLGPLMPKNWEQTIAQLQQARMQEWHSGKFTARALMRDDEYNLIVQRDLKFPRLDEEFKWMLD